METKKMTLGDGLKFWHALNRFTKFTLKVTSVIKISFVEIPIVSESRDITHDWPLKYLRVLKAFLPENFMLQYQMVILLKFAIPSSV